MNYYNLKIRNSWDELPINQSTKPRNFKKKIHQIQKIRSRTHEAAEEKTTRPLITNQIHQYFVNNSTKNNKSGSPEEKQVGNESASSKVNGTNTQFS